MNERNVATKVPESFEAHGREKAYQAWLRKNPQIKVVFFQMARELHKKGCRAYSAQDIVAVMRLRSQFGVIIQFPDGTQILPPKDEEPSMNLSRTFISYLARDLAIEDAKFRAFFDFKSAPRKGGGELF